MPERLRRLLNLLFGLLSSAMFGLAAGAFWVLPTLFTGRSIPALALPIGWLLGITVRRWLRYDGWTGAALAALATLVAAIYAACLTVGAMLSGAMSIGFAQALVDAGTDMLLELARLAQGPSDIALYIAGALLAAMTALPVGRGLHRS
ncbi:hypothetical protein [Luteibacter sp. CQ10]|uniref:hypothetical protein n=1 Tax=Luteibacter sp. CQ10 TaxID=2805821 RepID=UPI0034A1D21A